MMTCTSLRVALCCAVGFSGLACGGGDDDDDGPDGATDGPVVVDGTSPDAVTADGPPAAFLLSNQGLYADIATKTIAGDLIEYTPEFPLWSDGAEKRRWLRLPPGTQIDTVDPDRWVFPMGAELYKEFAAPDGTLLETRVIRRTGAGTDPRVDYFFGSFIWQDGEEEAIFSVGGARDVRGTQHDAPSVGQCFKCHEGEAGFVLGFSAVQLAAGTPSVTELETAGHLTTDIPRPIGPPAAAGATERAALGSLHAQCGHCHNPLGEGAEFAPSMVLRVAVADGLATVGQTAIVQSTCNSTFEYYDGPVGVDFRMSPGVAATSGIAFRAAQRGNGDAMPPTATEVVDPGAGAIDAWIEAMVDGVCPP